MAIQAQFSSWGDLEDRRGDQRLCLRLAVRGAIQPGLNSPVLIHDISEKGILLEVSVPLAVGKTLSVELPEAGDVEAVAVWTSGPYVGCRFENPISRSVLSATRLLNPAGAPDLRTNTEFEHPSREGFAEKLKHLRVGKGLSRSDLAKIAGVSKPTVWAWETGKSEPREGNRRKLDELFNEFAREWPVSRATEDGDSSSEFDEKSNSGEPILEPSLVNTIYASKRRISALAGIDIDCVQVTLKW